MPWVKGQSGNPRGRGTETIEVKEVRRLAQAKSKEAYSVIESLMVGAEKDSVRLAAAIAILRLAGVRWDTTVDVTVNAEPKASTRYSEVPTTQLLQMASVSSTEN